jgi:hypothetical protein
VVVVVVRQEDRVDRGEILEAKPGRPPPSCPRTGTARFAHVGSRRTLTPSIWIRTVEWVDEGDP